MQGSLLVSRIKHIHLKVATTWHLLKKMLLNTPLKNNFANRLFFLFHRRKRLLCRCGPGTSTAASSAIKTGSCTLSSGRKLPRGRLTTVRKRSLSTNRGDRRPRPGVRGGRTPPSLLRRRLSTPNWACWTARPGLCRCWTASSLTGWGRAPARRPDGTRGPLARCTATTGGSSLTGWTRAAAAAATAGAAGKTWATEPCTTLPAGRAARTPHVHPRLSGSKRTRCTPRSSTSAPASRLGAERRRPSPRTAATPTSQWRTSDPNTSARPGCQRSASSSVVCVSLCVCVLLAMVIISSFRLSPQNEKWKWLFPKTEKK